MQEEVDYEQAYQPVTEKLLEIMFDDMDAALREMGVGDMGVPRRVKRMAEALYGRFDAYEKALESKEAVHAALRRNVYGSAGEEEDINRLQLYLGYVADHLAQRPAARLAEGSLDLPDPESYMLD